jgi:hypothetical protein
MASINKIGDVIDGITARSKPGVTLSVAPTAKGGTYGIYKNGTLLYQFHLVTHPGASQTVKSGGASDANPTGAQLTVTDNNGVSMKVDAAQFIGSLR